MAVAHINVYSEYLGCNTDVNVIIPEMPMGTDPEKFYCGDKKYKVLWLLHGTSGDYSDWLFKTKISLYAQENDLIVVMPSAMCSDYLNWAKFGVGYFAYDYFLHELMPMIYRWFPASRKREDNYIAGLSMGGKGSMLFAVNNPHLFDAAASLSFPLYDIRRPLNVIKEKKVAPLILFGADRRVRRDNELDNAGGAEAYANSIANVHNRMIENFEKGVDMPRLYFCCGTEDHLYDEFKTLQAEMAEKNYGVIFEEEEGYGHEWRLWDIYIERVIRWFLYNK